MEIWQQLQAAGRYLGEHDLTWGNAGNLSARTTPERYLVTASGTRMDDLQEADFVECGLDGTVRAGQRKPSKETPMHRAIYAERPDIQAVLHASPFYSTLLACSQIQLPNNLFVENMYYLERVARIDYYHPGSVDLGQAVGAVARGTNMILMDNHGVLVYDQSVQEALVALHTLEMVSRMVVTARSAGISLKGLPEHTVNDFLERSGYRPRRRWMD